MNLDAAQHRYLIPPPEGRHAAAHPIRHRASDRRVGSTNAAHGETRPRAPGVRTFVCSPGLGLLTGAALLSPLLEQGSRTWLPMWLHGCSFGFVRAGPFAGCRLGLDGLWSDWDKVIHSFSGVLLGCTAIIALGLFVRRKQLHLPRSPFVAAVVVSGGFAAALWEITEYASDHLVGTHAQNSSLEETMTDIIGGFIGAVAVALVAGFHHGGHPRAPIGPLLRNRDFTTSSADRDRRSVADPSGDTDAREALTPRTSAEP